MLEQVESAYETVFPTKPADYQFYGELEFAYAAFQKRTTKRPIRPRDVKNAQRLFRDECRKLMAEAKRRIQDGGPPRRE